MNKTIFLLSLIMYTGAITHAQTTYSDSTASVKWYNIEEAGKLITQTQKPIFVDTYTDWCGWCKKMDRETFSNEIITEILNDRFYPVKFNAETKESIDFLGKTFINDGTAGKAHQLALALTQGQLSYPTIIFIIPEDGKYSVSPIPGFKNPTDMEVILSYFADKAYKTENLEEYLKDFKSRIQ